MPESLSAVERHRLVDEWANGVELCDVPPVSCLIRSGRRVPSVRTAVRCGGHILTYAELYERLDGAVTGTAGPTLDDLARLLTDIAAAATDTLLPALGPIGTGLSPDAVAAAADDRRAVAADQRARCVDRACGSSDVRLLATRWDCTDAAVELLAALADGATLVLATEMQRTRAVALADLIVSCSATHVMAEAETLNILAELPAVPALPTVRRWDVIGTSCTARLSELLRDMSPASCAGFSYAAPEYAGVSARGPLDGSGRLRPIPGARLLVLDAALCPVPPGTSGDVYLGGAALAVELTTAATGFITDPFVPDARLARTGLRGRWTAEGWLTFDAEVAASVEIDVAA